MVNRTYLATYDGMADYAKRHGAKYDRERGAWYIEGDVPDELLGLLPKKPNPSVHIVAPSCPECGSHMLERVRKRDGQMFWGCSRYPICKGMVDYEQQLEQLEASAAKPIKDFLKSENAKDVSASSAKKTKHWSMSSQHRLAVRRVVDLAADVLGGNARVEKWLSSPKVTLNGKIPLDLMRTESGCVLVEKLLLTIRD